MHVTWLEVVGPAQTPAIPVARKEKEELPAEELRLRHRVLDLRRPELQRNLILRHRLMQATRRYFDAHGFLEIETPILTKPTPEGRAGLPGAEPGASRRVLRAAPVAAALQAAADGGGLRPLLPDRALLPRRGPARRPPAGVHPDRHRGLVHRPGGRARVRRGPGAVAVGGGRARRRGAAFRGCATPRRWSGTAATSPTCATGSRSSTPPTCSATPTSPSPDAAIRRAAGSAGSGPRAARRSPGNRSTRSKAAAKTLGAAGLLRLKRSGDSLEGGPAKFLAADAADRLGLADGDLALLVAGPDHVSSPALDRVRQELARRLDLIPPGVDRFVWIVDFPLFEKDPATGALSSGQPSVHRAASGRSAPARHRAGAGARAGIRHGTNGNELGGGSLRITDPRLQRRVFGLLGIPEDQAERGSGFCSRVCAPARRRTVGSPSASTGS